MKLFSFETLSKLTRCKNVYVAKNLHNFVYDCADAWHGTFRFRVKTDSQTIFYQTILLDVIFLYEKQKYDERWKFSCMQKVMISSELFSQ